MTRLAAILGVFTLSSCSSTWSAVKSSAWPAGGAAAGAVVGSTVAPPIGTVAGAAIGAVVGHGLGENSELRSGSLQGEGALERELERWKGRAVAAEGARSFMQKSKESLMSILQIAAIAALGWFVWRNRANIKTMGVTKGLWHGIVGGAKP